MEGRSTRIIVTLGPASAGRSVLRRMKAAGVDFVRTNMSHSSLGELETSLAAAREAGLRFIIDTEGSQVRTGDLARDVVYFRENAEVTLWNRPIRGDDTALCLRPPCVIGQLDPGDLVHIDFDTLILRVVDVSTAGEGYVTAQAVAGGYVGRNKAVVIDPVVRRPIDLPALSEKDLESIAIGVREGVEHVAVSFVRSAAALETVRAATGGRMKIISKIECVEALQRLDEIIEGSDALLIDRGDLSKEVPLERIPFTQKVVIERARRAGRDVYVATNLLETMVERRKPTRAEIQDVVNTLMDGATGLTLAAETAIGRHPIDCINMLDRLICHTERVRGAVGATPGAGLAGRLVGSAYLDEAEEWLSLVPPHGGRLVHRIHEGPAPDPLARIALDRRQQVELEQIALGAYSPLEGFLGAEDLASVLRNMRLADGTVWPLPVVLEVDEAVAAPLRPGTEIGLTDPAGRLLGVLELTEKHTCDRRLIDEARNGAARRAPLSPVLLAGPVRLLRRRRSPTGAWELSPRQTRRLFHERGWVRVLGFHARNVADRGLEFVLAEAMERCCCDGLFLHPVIGDELPGELHPRYVLGSWQCVVEQFDHGDRALLAAFSAFCRSGGPREALFAAICRKNFGCSHFVLGRDGRAGLRDADRAVVMELCAEIGITLVPADEIFYSPGRDAYLRGPTDGVESDGVEIVCGSAARAMLEAGRVPPPWLVRPEVSRMLLDAINAGQEVFVIEGQGRGRELRAHRA